MKVKVETHITTYLDVDTLEPEHHVEVTAEAGVPEDLARAATAGACRAIIAQLDPQGDAEGDADVDTREIGPEMTVHKGLEVGEQVYLDEDVYQDPPVHTPARVYLFEQFDSEAPVETNCTLVDVATGDWTVRGIGELVPVDGEEV